jgi:hypothetical protein
MELMADKPLKPNDRRHGTLDGYLWPCRCQRCTAAIKGRKERLVAWSEPALFDEETG